MPNIKVATEEGVAVLTIDHPPVNSLSRDTMMELDQALTQLQQDVAVKVVVITGGGSLAFVAGAEIKEIANIGSPQDGQAAAQGGQRVLDKIEQSSKPVIAAINGVCLGGGNELAMACHMRIAGDRARFGQPEISLGIMPGFGGTQRLPRMVGPSKATELILTGDLINAAEALRIGLVNRVVPQEEVIKHARDLAKKIASKGQVAVRLCMEAIRASLAMPLAQGLAFEVQQFGKVCATLDMQEGLKAFLEKRQPKFQDR